MTDDHDEIRKAATEIGECPHRLVAYYLKHGRALAVTPDAFVLSLRSLFRGRVIITVRGQHARSHRHPREPER